jgi:GT2 family glycosyltransferase
MATQYDNLEIVVADNGSTDQSIEVIQKEFSQVTLITHPTNEGFAGGYNWALKESEGGLLCLIKFNM